MQWLYKAGLYSQSPYKLVVLRDVLHNIIIVHIMCLVGTKLSQTFNILLVAQLVDLPVMDLVIPKQVKFPKA